MAYIKLTLNHPLVDGENVTFKAPCDCTAVTGLKIYYVTLTEDAETEVNQTFTFKDAHGNDLTNVGNLFTNGAYIKAILDTTNNYAYLQNADTNAYLESAMTTKAGNLINRTTAVNEADINYTTLMARGESLHSTETTPALNGAICWLYE